MFTNCLCGVNVQYEWVNEADIPVAAKPYLPLQYPGPGGAPEPPEEGLALFRVTHYGRCEQQFAREPEKRPWYRRLYLYEVGRGAIG